LFIHIGYGKTGTTFIQTFFYKNHTKIDNFYYPIPKKRAARHLQLSSLNKPYFDKKEWIKIKEEIESVNENKILISTEEFIYDKKFHQNFNFVKELFSNYKIKIIVTVNNYVEMIYKPYLEFIKKYDNKYACNNIYKFIDKFQNNFQHKELDKFKNFFKNVSLILYSKTNLLQDFCKILEIKLPKNIEQISNLNPSIGIEYSSFLEKLFSSGLPKSEYLGIVNNILKKKNLEKYEFDFFKFSDIELEDYRNKLVNDIKQYIDEKHSNIPKSYYEKILGHDI
jgi:hypothetical protein